MKKAGYSLLSLLIVTGMFAFTPVAEGSASGGKLPVWWERAEKEARETGYLLMTPESLRELKNSGESFLLLDVRPDYEFRTGYIPGSMNFEFHLGDRLRIGPEKEKSFTKLLGEKKDRKVVIYCRSFR